MRASRSGMYWPAKKTMRFGSASAFTSHLLKRFAVEFPSPPHGAFVECYPARILDHAAQGGVNARPRKRASDLQQRAEHHHVGCTGIAQLVGDVSERERQNVDVFTLAVCGKLLAVVDDPTTGAHVHV